MPIQEIRSGSLLVTGVTSEKLDALNPWINDGQRINEEQFGGHKGFSTMEALRQVKQEDTSYLSVPVRSPEGRWSVVLHPGQNDVDLKPIAQALDH